jgi:hypothetical protein
MKKPMTAALAAALLAAMGAAHAGGKVGGDPTVTRSGTYTGNGGGGGVTKPKDVGVGTQPVQKPAGTGPHSGTPQRQGLQPNGTDLQGTDAQATQAPAAVSHQLDTLTLRGEPLVDVRLVEGELTARTARQVLLPGR